jgi:hydrogenase maturation protein HypF
VPRNEIVSPPAQPPECGADTAAARVRLGGRVQGVGYRPFVFRLARQYAIAGSVRNLLGEVEVIAEGRAHAIEQFMRSLVARAPPFAAPRILEREPLAPAGRSDFVILRSAAEADAGICVPPDLFTCADCLRELQNPHDRRYGYPFINCTQCGPRYTLIDALPYDRINTTMASFTLCERCRAEYSDAADRRFHAEPVACSICGPQLSLEQAASEPITVTRDVLARAVLLLRAGAVLAVKGIGGYHLMCDACNPAAVDTLRKRKHRPHKPLAVMFPQTGIDGLDSLHAHVVLEAAVQEALFAPARPIVLAARRADSTLAAQIAPGLDEIGVFLPYSPLHHLLLHSFDGPLVATSGNVSGEPVLYDNAEARAGLGPTADAFLHHNRRIARPADDSVVRVIERRARILRLGRGMAPLEVDLPGPEEPLLAVGGHMKTTVALAWQGRAVISPHIGDMGTVRSERVFGQVVADLQKLYGVRAHAVVCDAHPGYATTRWARASGLPITMVLHHHAHASALVGERVAECAAAGPALVFTWDGVGYGADGTLWGGEGFLGRPGEWCRVASLRPFRLPGGDRAARAPWRSAAAMCWEAGIDWGGNPADPLIRQAWQHALNSPLSSAAGRLFDAAAALVLGVREATFEGQGPMLLEACASATTSSAPALPLYEDAAQVLRADWAPLIASLIDSGIPADVRAGHVHATLAQTIVEVAQRLRTRHAFSTVGLTGGVFQNRKLTEWASAALRSAGFHVWLNGRVPCNDGGLSFGQLVEACARARQPATFNR